MKLKASLESVKSPSKARQKGVFGNCMELVAIELTLEANNLFSEGERLRGHQLSGE